MIRKHTQGPWWIDENITERIEITSASRSGMVEIAALELGFDEPFETEQLANAILIVAAPDLFAALERIAGNGPDSAYSLRGAKQIARAALAKARGEG